MLQRCHRGGSGGIGRQLPENPSEHVRQIPIPVLSCTVLWPFAFEKANEATAWRFPYGDRLIVAKLKDGLTPQQAVAASLKSAGADGAGLLLLGALVAAHPDYSLFKALAYRIAAAAGREVAARLALLGNARERERHHLAADDQDAH